MSPNTVTRTSLSEFLTRFRALAAKLFERGTDAPTSPELEESMMQSRSNVDVELAIAAEEYDPVEAAEEAGDAIARVIECPQVNDEFKERVRAFAKARSADLRQLGNAEAASQYDLASAGSPRRSRESQRQQRAVVGW